ncbi:hybrid sensor histidine kinase/response regulator transcription factor [Pontibacter harenae]|uniref:hybrid sensor histidine kinase/response regulator transcription factor n=1 Tax=Pontibacter harenae TaxID=2894083 RepID=UPI001E58931A|nr:hybrid sensor histidine kinase/response regulator transcription factor [Pontibacter harenae]
MSQVLAAPQDQYRFSLIDVNNGLSHNQVTSFLKDSKGFIWIGTDAGLNRYDGYNIKAFRHDSKDAGSISGNNVSKLFEDPAGNILVKVMNGGFDVYNPTTEQFSHDQHAFLKRYSLPVGEIEEIVKDRQGNYWFVQPGQGITKYDPKAQTSVTLKHNPHDRSSISSNNITAIAQSSEGFYWVMNQSGVLEKLNQVTLKVADRIPYLADQISSNSIAQGLKLTIDKGDDLWIYSPFDGIGAYHFSSSKKSFIHFHKNSPAHSLNSNLVRGIVEDAEGNIWLGTDHGGINIIDKSNFSVQYVVHNPEVKSSLVHNSINALYKDNEGIIWLGTYKKGVNYYHKDAIRFQHFKNQLLVKGTLPYDDVNRFVEDKKGNLWIGTNGGGLLYFNRETGKYTRYRHNPKDHSSISSDVVVSLLLDKENTLWVGTYLGGLNKFDGKKFIRYTSEASDALAISDNNVWELFEDSRGNMWVGTMHGGLQLFDRKIEAFHHYLTKNKARVKAEYVAAIAEDHKGNIWIGGNKGVEVLHRQTGKVTAFVNSATNTNSLSSNNIFTIFCDSRNNVWLGTPEGLNLYNEEDQSFRVFTKEDGLPHNIILNVVEDNSNNLWVSTPNGISQLILSGKDAKSLMLKTRNYDESDGLQSKSFNENAAYKTKKGEILFGGPNGFNLFHPHDLRINQSVPKVVFTDFQLFNQGIEVHPNGKGKLTSAINETESITLEHDENVFSIEFAALNFLQPIKNQYRYKLEGFDKEWHTTDGANRRVTYTNLDPGTYQFKVMASNNDGVWNREGATMELVVLAPFWRTYTAYFIYMLTAVGLLILIRKIELQRTRSKFVLEQERREAKQLRELDMMKLRFFTNLSHELKTPLALILAPLDKLLNSTTEPEQLKQFQMINRNAKRLLNLVTQLLDFRKLEVEKVSLYPCEGNIVKFIKESVNSFSELSEKKNITLTFHANLDELQASFDMDKLEKILFNLLSNAFKFTPEYGSIDVEVNCHDNDSSSEGLKIVELKVKDTGIGIAKEKQELIFERFYKNDVPSNFLNQGSGIGLAITKEFVRIHGGMITVESEPGKGSCFTVTIPVKELTSYKEITEAVGYETESLVLTKVHAEEKDGEAAVHAESKPNILLVEDNEDFRSYLKDSLGAFYTITEAKNGKEGWQKALAGLPDLIVSDLMMPELNGIELCKKVKNDARTSHIPFILLTAHTAEEQKVKGLDIGANDYITKPFSLELFLSRIRNLVTQHQLLHKALEKKISVQSSEEQIVSLDDKLVQNAIRVVEENLSDPDFSVELMSKELGMSRVHLYKKLLAITGTSPVEFIRKIRLQHAAQLLEKSQLTVAEVAYKVGFNNRKYFTKYFKEEYQILPSAYAESKQKQTSLN